MIRIALGAREATRCSCCSDQAIHFLASPIMIDSGVAFSVSSASLAMSALHVPVRLGQDSVDGPDRGLDFLRPPIVQLVQSSLEGVQQDDRGRRVPLPSAGATCAGTSTSSPL